MFVSVLLVAVLAVPLPAQVGKGKSTTASSKGGPASGTISPRRDFRVVNSVIRPPRGAAIIRDGPRSPKF